jgi:hypothetical protein
MTNISPAKKNIAFIVTIFFLLGCELYITTLGYKSYKDIWGHIFRAIISLIIVLWYYEMEKNRFGKIQRMFLISNTFPFIVSLILPFIGLLSFSPFSEKRIILSTQNIVLINLVVYTLKNVLWIFIFKSMGAFAAFNNSLHSLKNLIVVFFIFPLLYFFISLYPATSGISTIISFSYIFIFSFAGVLSAFLPIDEKKRFWITIGIVTVILGTILRTYDEFLLKITWGNELIGIVIVASRCMVTYGMIDYEDQEIISDEEY